MATSGLVLDNISTELAQLIDLIKNKQNFLLSGGAGSGKTYSLVKVLTAVTKNYPSLNIGCITYTNAAVKEIEERVQHANLYVSTIHDFLWKNIKYFQRELKETLIELINDPLQTKIKLPNDEECSGNFFDGCDSIQYKEYLKLDKGIISHDEIIILASKMFEKYEKLCSLTKDKYPFIFVDEYQDTNPLVVKILLDSLEKSPKQNVIGFFGDAMQSIYEDSVGNLNEYTQTDPPKVIEIFKQQNRRNPDKVINLANQLRTDGLIQVSSEDPSAPNMDGNGHVLQGDIKFIHSDSDNIKAAREYLGWDFLNNEQVKELNLTHNLIANKAKFPNLMRIYNGDKIHEFVRNKVRKYLADNDIGFDTSNKTLSQVLEHVGIAVNPTPGQKNYIDEYPKDYELALSQPYDKLYNSYIDKDQLLDDKKSYVGDDNKPSSNRDVLIKHLFKIENCLRLYESKQYNQFIKSTDYSINSVRDKQSLNTAIKSFMFGQESIISYVIDSAHDLGLVIKDDQLVRFSEEKGYLYNLVGKVSYQEFRNVYEYLEGYLPFSTQHKTKGAEFPSVLVVLDNGQWNQYNFKYLFERDGTESVRQRTEKIFYVCCTRAMENLAVFYKNPTSKVLATAEEWFGKDNIINIDTLNITP